MTNDQKGFAHLDLLALFVVLCLFIGGVFFYIKDHQPHSTVTNHANPTEACHTKAGVQMCLSTSKARLSSSETTQLKTVITNTTSQKITETFNCDFTDPSIILNGNDLDSAVNCEQTITPVTITAGTSKTFTYDLGGSKLKTGSNVIKSVWASYESGTITIQKNPTTATDVAQEFKACQSLKDNVDFNDVPDYCASIDIVLYNSDSGQYSCTAWKNLFQKINLAIPCTSVMDIGVGYIYVPREDANKYLAQVKSLSEVSDSHIDAQQ